MPQAPAALVYERRPRPFSSTHLDSRGKRAAWLELCHLLGPAVCRWSCERPQSIAHLSSLGRSHLEKNGRIRLVCPCFSAASTIFKRHPVGGDVEMALPITGWPADQGINYTH